MNSALHELSLVPEVTYGTTPGTPAFLKKKITGTTLGLTKGIMESETINPNRQLDDVRHGTRQVGGDIMVELNYDGYADLLEAVLCGTWAANVLVPGTERRSFSVLRNFTDMDGAGNPFHLSKGVELNTLNLSLTTEAFVKATFGCLGRELIMAATAPVDSTFADPSDKKAFDSFSGFLKIDDVAVADVTELTLDLENGLEPRFVLFDDKTQQPKIGRTRVTGNLNLYFKNSDMLAAFNGGQKKSLEFELEDVDGNTLTFLLPSILGTGGQTDVQGESDIVIAYPFTAVYEAGAATPDVLKITRTAA